MSASEVGILCCAAIVVAILLCGAGDAMALMQWPTELNGIPLSSRTQWLLFAPMWMMFPKPRNRLMGTPIRTIEQGLIDRLHYDPDTGMLYVLNRTGAWDRVRSVAARGLEGWVRP